MRLMTIRSEGQFNTVVYEEEDIYRAQDRRDVANVLVPATIDPDSKTPAFKCVLVTVEPVAASKSGSVNGHEDALSGIVPLDIARA